MEAVLPSLRGRRCYGAVVDGEYWACASMLAGDDPAAFGLGVWEVPGGKYVRLKLTDFHSKTHLIPATFEELEKRADYDPTRPNIEYYRSEREPFLMAPVNQ